jgi:hypothetical protein
MSFQKKQRIPRTFDEYLEQMPADVLRGLRVWLSLNDSERGLLGEAIEQVKQLPEPDRKRLPTTILPTIITNIPLGPFGKPCPWCGRELKQ